MKIEKFLEKEQEKLLMTEAGFSRVVQKMVFDKKDFATISAFREEYTKAENLNRNKKLRSEFAEKKMGAYPLIGYWKECQDKTIDYEKCPEELLIDVIERSFLVVRPETMSIEDFKNFLISMTKKYEQDACVLAVDDKIIGLKKDGGEYPIGTGVTLNKIARGYSRYVRKKYIPFVFEAQIPGSISGRMVFTQSGLSYPEVEDRDEINIIFD